MLRIPVSFCPEYETILSKNGFGSHVVDFKGSILNCFNGSVAKRLGQNPKPGRGCKFESARRVNLFFLNENNIIPFVLYLGQFPTEFLFAIVLNMGQEKFLYIGQFCQGAQMGHFCPKYRTISDRILADFFVCTKKIFLV